ncbi:26381_t:CDS:2 [Gigaspora margarita]|uniref:26381_t:CDS:1 n=1 Tax=Gigaspora margarita TaxID=4874 RepID=A0ABN7WLV2_GIGMA|nr:26381_t:CDS:2 [Gigaspora margarita]
MSKRSMDGKVSDNALENQTNETTVLKKNRVIGEDLKIKGHINIASGNNNSTGSRGKGKDKLKA